MKTAIAIVALGLLAGCRSEAQVFVDDLCACRGDQRCIRALEMNMEQRASRDPGYDDRLARDLADHGLNERMMKCMDGAHGGPADR